MLELVANNEIARLLALAVLFAIVVIGVMAGARIVSRRAQVRSALDSIAQGPAQSAATRLRERRDTAWSQLADKIESTGLSLEDSKADSLRQTLRAAGFTSPAAPRMFTLIRLVLVLALPVGYFLLTSANQEERTFATLYLYPALLALAGLYLPNLFVRARADRRREQITNGFPDCLDLMLVSVEAGLGLEAAMDRVGREMVRSHPLVAEVLSAVTLQLRAGAQRDEALRRMGETSGVDEIRSFATLLIQSDRLGTSIAETLRVYSAEMREKRRMRAEEKAHRLPVLISIPLVVCMLPTMIGVLMMPGVIRVIRQLIPALGGE